MNITPFLLFDGSCDEAMRFYQQCFGGDLAISIVRDTPMRDALPPEHQDKVAHARLHNGPMELAAADWMHPTRNPTIGNTVALYLQSDSSFDLRTVFDRLADGANPDLLDDLRATPIGTYGHLADRFGVHWFFRGEA